ncbi:MAG: sensor domain-containing diguanylate cyclase [Methylophaga sp.]|nr:sensor domain-containing diguanylate cyclase [Methylophaga sp.]
MAKEQINGWLTQRQHLLETQRQLSLEALNLKEVLDEKRFRCLTWIAKQLFNVDTSYIAIVDAEHQWIRAAQGALPDRTKRAEAFCSLTIIQDKTLVLDEVHQDPRFMQSTLVIMPPFIKFYAGCPIYAPSGEKLGTMSIAHNASREFSPSEDDLLMTLAEMVNNEIAVNPMLDEDHLTGLLNRRGFESRAEKLLKLCHEHNHLLSMCYFDLDNFKLISGQEGESAGEETLRNFADLLRGAFADCDLLARYGGDEFVVLGLSGTLADSKGALLHLKTSLEDFNQQQNPRLRIAYSFGLASTHETSSLDLQALYTLCDEDMRNRRDSRNKTSAIDFS